MKKSNDCPRGFLPAVAARSFVTLEDKGGGNKFL